MHTITPTTALPTITSPVLIDGYTQPRSSPNTLTTGNNAALKIELNGNERGHDGLQITQHLEQRDQGSRHKPLRGAGIYDIPATPSGNRIEGNFIGTDPTGTLDRGNGGAGVSIYNGPTENVVGGTTPAARNLISGNVPASRRATGPSGVQQRDRPTASRATTSAPTGAAPRTLTATIFAARPSSSTTPRASSSGGKTAGVPQRQSSGNGVIRPGDSCQLRTTPRCSATASAPPRAGPAPSATARAEFWYIGLNNSSGTAPPAGSNTIAFNGKDGIEVERWRRQRDLAQLHLLQHRPRHRSPGRLRGRERRHLQRPRRHRHTAPTVCRTPRFSPQQRPSRARQRSPAS